MSKRAMRIAAKLKAKEKIPVVREIPFSADSLLEALLSLDPARRVSILDSGGARHEDEARYLIAGFDPCEVIEVRGDRCRVMRPGGSFERAACVDALQVLDERLESYRTRQTAAPHLPVAGACIATFAYDLVRQIERLRSPRRYDNRSEPDALLAFYDTLVVHDYARRRTEIVSINGPESAEKFYTAINDAANSAQAHPPGLMEDSLTPAFQQPSSSSEALSSNFTREEYVAAVRRIKEHIAAGDIYQANLTQQLSLKLDRQLRPEHVFQRLRRDHPASFSAFVRRREDTIISASPERFLRVEVRGTERRVEAWPIKGTRPRGRNAQEDQRLRAELQASEKDRAENVMIVDLLRNDLGRVCEYGSVEVPELFRVQEHPTLFHLVSKVRGRLRQHFTAGDLLRAAFPCGSVTGAPKIRAMEIIDQVENVPRGLSMGAIGYFSFDGRLDLNVAIRTMTVNEGMARFNVGGGIVADSDPLLEYEESLVKARALLRALGVVES